MLLRRPNHPAIASPTVRSFDDGKHSKEQAKYTVRTPRVWLMVVLLFVIGVSHWYNLLPTPGRSNSSQRTTYTNSHLRPFNYLNSSNGLPANPFPFCGADHRLDEGVRKYGIETTLNLGTGTRVNRVISRALAGQSVTISILGSSGAYMLSMTASLFMRRMVLGLIDIASFRVPWFR
jgi:hypothetical protein